MKKLPLLLSSLVILMLAALANLAYVVQDSYAFSRSKAPAASPLPSPSPSPSVSPGGLEPGPTPSASPSKALAYFGAGASPTLLPGGSDYEWGQGAIAALNDAWTSGCIIDKALQWDFKSLHGVIEPWLQPHQKTEAVARFAAGAPYSLDARWYYTLSGIIGYTYNFKDGKDSGPTETRIWTNTRLVGSAYDYASHLTHELSHQARAGGFVHYSFHQGSFPYEIGDIAFECINERQSPKMMMLASAPSRMRKSGARPVPRRSRPIPDTIGCYR